MRISRLQLRNFRCFESLDLELDQTTVLVGANDTGKSVVLEALGWLLDSDAICDWHSALRRTSGLSDHPAGLILAELADFTPSEIEEWMPIAPDGILRLAKSSLSGSDLKWAADGPGLARLVAQFDPEECLLVHETVDRDSVTAQMLRSGEFVAFDENLTLVDLQVFQYGIEPFERLIFALPTLVSVVALGGPTDASWSPKSVVRPIIRSRIHALLAGNEIDNAMGMINDGVVRLGQMLSGRHTARLSSGGSFSFARWQSNLEQVWLVEAIVNVVVESFRLEVRHRSAHGRLEVPIGELGPGSNRALALAGLDLYSDPDFNPRPGPNEHWTSDLVLLLVEEPETGLHAAAQRRLAKSLRALATFGLQLVMVTHSPAFLNSTEAAGVRLARRIEASDAGTIATVVRPEGLSEIRASLGIEPADILLARRFVVVEGNSDRLVLVSWARRLGLDLRELGVQLIPCDGHARAELVARFLKLAYEGADFVVILDNGPDTPKAQRDIIDQHGDRVEAILLTRTAIEGYYHPRAITAWLRSEGAAETDLEQMVEEKWLRSQNREETLQDLCHKHLGRGLRKVSDGEKIANLTQEQDIDPEIQERLLHIGREE